MNKRKISQSGFTLIELMLAMSLFTAVLLVATVGFIGMNRTFSRGLIRKQLSEQSQALTSSVTNVIRASGGSVTPVNCSEGSASATCSGDFNGVCIGSTRFVWLAPSSKKYGLYSQQAGCKDAFNAGDSGTTQIMDNRYEVVSFSVKPVGVDDLYQVSGIFRTTDDDAFNNLTDPNPIKIQCKGSAETSAVRSCAVVKINLTINARKVGTGDSI